jgi:twitching motility protein PilT
VNLLDSLLDAIIRLDGDALVMHVGEKPYVVTTSEATNEFRGPLIWGQVELSSRVLTSEALTGMLGQILPLDQRAALDEFGATEFDVFAAHEHAERFTIVAARGGDDIWLELRRLAKLNGEIPAAAVVQEERVAPAPVHTAVAIEEPVDAGPAAVDGVPEQPVDVSEYASEDVIAEVEPSAAHADAYEAAELTRDLTAPLDSVEEETLIPDEEHFRSVTHVIGEQDWGDVMTEGDLGELLRASAATIVRGEAAEGRDHRAETAVEPRTEHGETYLRMPIALGDQPAFAERAAEITIDEEITPAFDTVALEEMDGAAEWVGDEPGSDANEGHPARADAAEGVSGAAVESGEQASEAQHEETSPAVAEEVHATESETSVPVTTGIETMADEVKSTGERAAFGDQPFSVLLEAESREAQQDNVHAFASAHDGASERQSSSAHMTEGLADEDATPFRQPAVVVPLTRQTRPDTAGEVKGGTAATLQRLLRLAAARGAATVYVVAQSAPMVRVDGEFSVLDGEPTLSGTFVERLLTEVAPQTRDGAAAAAEWITDVPEIGRVRCVTFRDHRGPGIIFRLVPARAIAAEQLGLSAEVQALSTDADGLVLVAGGRGSGRSTLLTSFVDLVNRTRSDHVITIEPHIEFVHENKRSFISQREVRGTAEAVAAAARAASREEPDVLVIEDLRTPELAGLALEAAEAGRLVFASLPADSSVAAVERFIEAFPADRREKARTALAATLRGVISQVLLRRLRGGRVAAREVLINTPEVATRIAEGKTAELSQTLEAGRKYGMMPFAESLAALVREGTVHPSHAFRKAPDREQFLAALRRDGVDVAIAEQLG